MSACECKRFEDPYAWEGEDEDFLEDEDGEVADSDGAAMHNLADDVGEGFDGKAGEAAAVAGVEVDQLDRLTERSATARAMKNVSGPIVWAVNLALTGLGFVWLWSEMGLVVAILALVFLWWVPATLTLLIAAVVVSPIMVVLDSTNRPDSAGSGSNSDADKR